MHKINNYNYIAIGSEFQGKIFIPVDASKTVKSMKVLVLENFRLYGIY